MPNIYFVLSEVIEDHVNCCSLDPPEDYCICNLVVAEKHSQAKWLAWKKDNKYGYDISEMPKFKVHVKKKDVDMPIGIIEDSHKPEYDEFWE
jgi:hypothetical protein